MKDCSKLHPLLSLYVEKVLSDEEKALVEAHLKACPEAREELKEFQQLSEGMQQIPEPKFPKDLHGKIMDRLQEEPASPGRAWGSWSLAAAACLAVLLGLQQLNDQKDTKSELVLKPITTPLARENQPVVLASRPIQSKASENQVLAMAKDAAPVPATSAAGAGVAETSHTLAVQKPDMVVAMAAPAQPRAMKMAEKKTESLSDEAASAMVAPAARGPSSTPQALNYLLFKADPTTPRHYQVQWQTDLATKGQVLLVDAVGNTLQVFAEPGGYVYDHRMTVDTSAVDQDFLIRLLMNDPYGHQGVTQTGPFKP